MGSALSNPNSTAIVEVDSNSAPAFEWQWQTDDLMWRSYSKECSAAIEAARLEGRSFLEIKAFPASTPTHLIFFQQQQLRQVNLRTYRGRPVRRCIGEQSLTAVWEWWKEEKGQWHEYRSELTLKFEAAWLNSIANQKLGRQDCPAGVFFKLKGRTYSILFEAEAVQCNVKTSFHRNVRRCSCLQNQTSTNCDANSHLNTNLDLASDDSTFEIGWQWQTDDLQWYPYNHACSFAIESAYANGQVSAQISLLQGSSPTHCIYFKNQVLGQVNRRTHRLRPVRRFVNEKSSFAIWQWWEEEESQWHKYNDYLTKKFEATWNNYMASCTSDCMNCPAGVFFKLNGRKYSILFEADAIQCNLKNSNRRNVRRCTYFSDQLSKIQPVNMDHSQDLNGTLHGQVIRNEQDQSNECYLHPEHDSTSNSDDDDECSICLCSLHEGKVIELVKCHHFFHRKCIEQWFKTCPTCPQCLAVYDVISGNQPPGDMSVHYISFSSKEAENGMEGYPGVDIIEITYRFSNGIQSAEHPAPGTAYAGNTYVAYLPKNKEGEEILELLEIAWSRRLLFTVGSSLADGQKSSVIWAGIHHKTQKNGGESNNGYPDQTYFARVKKQLADVNIM